MLRHLQNLSRQGQQPLTFCVRWTPTHCPRPRTEPNPAPKRFHQQDSQTRPMGEKEGYMKGIIAWLMGVPVIAIILLYYFDFF